MRGLRNCGCGPPDRARRLAADPPHCLFAERRSIPADPISIREPRHRHPHEIPDRAIFRWAIAGHIHRGLSHLHVRALWRARHVVCPADRHRISLLVGTGKLRGGDRLCGEKVAALVGWALGIAPWTGRGDQPRVRPPSPRSSVSSWQRSPAALSRFAARLPHWPSPRFCRRTRTGNRRGGPSNSTSLQPS